MLIGPKKIDTAMGGEFNGFEPLDYAKAEQPGSYSRRGSRIQLVNRRFQFWDALQEPQLLTVMARGLFGAHRSRPAGARSATTGRASTLTAVRGVGNRRASRAIMSPVFGRVGRWG